MCVGRPAAITPSAHCMGSLIGRSVSLTGFWGRCGILAKSILLQATREPQRLLAALEAVVARPAFQALCTPEARQQRAAWVADLAARRPPPPPDDDDARAAYVDCLSYDGTHTLTWQTYMMVGQPQASCV